MKVGGREAASAKAPGQDRVGAGRPRQLDRDEPAQGQRLRVAGGSLQRWIKVKVKVAWSRPTLCDPMDYTARVVLQARILEWVPFPSPKELPNPEMEPSSPTLQADSLPAEPQGKPKNTGVGSLSLLQQIFLTQESNRGLLQADSLPLSRKPLYVCVYESLCCTAETNTTL